MKVANKTTATQTKAATARVAVLDAGGQYIDLVKKAVERVGFKADVLPLTTPPSQLTSSYQAIVISGSPASSHSTRAPMPNEAIWAIDLPILGICYGMQAMVMAAGGQVTRGKIREDGRITTTVDTSHAMFSGSKAELTALFTHGDFVSQLPSGFKAIGRHSLTHGQTVYSAIAKGNLVGLQFHPEVFDDTPQGYQLFKNFFEKVAGLTPDKAFMARQTKQVIQALQHELKQRAGDRHVIAFASGGVDSTVALTLAAQVVKPEKLHAFYIDSGFMRDEDDQVIELLKATGVNVKTFPAAHIFAKATTVIDGQPIGPLDTVTDPEHKRKIIGKCFIDIQNQLVKDLALPDALLLQGTNAADRIESGNSKADTNTDLIKTHHNQVAEVQALKVQGRLLEPLDDLFKNEIREVGRQLGLPDEVVQRHPFPGPALAIQIICSPAISIKITPQQNQQLRLTVQSLVSKGHVEAQFLPIKSVGVGGDERSLLMPIAVHGTFSTAQLEALGATLPATYRDTANRVIVALAPQPIADYQITSTRLTPKVIAQLRQANAVVFEEMRRHELLQTIKEFPVVLLPLSFGKFGQRSLVLRPITTSTWLTVQAMLPERDLPQVFFDSVVKRLCTEVKGISQVFLDITNKPPGTTQWE